MNPVTLTLRYYSTIVHYGSLIVFRSYGHPKDSTIAYEILHV